MAAQSSSRGSGGPHQTTLQLMYRPPGSEGSRLYSRILSSKAVRNAVVMNVLKIAWARFGTVKMNEVDENTMAFEFGNEGDKQQILDLSPWSVQGNCLNLRSCSADMTLEELNFDKLDVWIQVHGLSLGVNNAENAR